MLNISLLSFSDDLHGNSISFSCGFNRNFYLQYYLTSVLNFDVNRIHYLLRIHFGASDCD